MKKRYAENLNLNRICFTINFNYFCSMIHTLPSFQIEITEEQFEQGKSLIHRIAINTSRICKDLPTAVQPIDHIKVEKKKEEVVTTPPKVFYTKIASQLSALNEQQLMDNFSGMRVCYKFSRSEKTYPFTF